MRAATVFIKKNYAMNRTICLIYEGDLDTALNRVGYPMRMAQVISDREITDYVVNGQRTILMRG